MANYKKIKCTEKICAFNTNYIIYLLGFGFSLWGDIYLLIKDKRLSWILSTIVIVCLFLICADAVFYVFTKREMIHIHFWGYRWFLPWSSVSSIEKRGFFWGSMLTLPCYEIWYNKIHKRKVIRKTISIPVTYKTKKYLNMYYVGNISGEKRKKK